ncbi:hypothetical protein KOR34_36380 [Posidoniimonas corsicana]|uniref:Major Facilitator Superfamily protein n=1 Tax=Posidoniimonas corsicana TaxID=1938618 RepID=A0A5C5V5I1_9BACT|nr:DUF5690 family protein [Posidoniimonas corsicana]TWT33804.1 hypothetical protein KOR34_36380 [Posidoniimonas corsicana]
MNSWVARRLENASPQVFSAYCIAAAFGTYFCMYAFRKPFTAGTFDGESLYGVDYKTVLVVSQVLGYTVSKFVGIRVIAELPPSRRATGILGLIAVAHAALLLFGMTPRPYNFVFLFINGLPLGMVFGLVLSFLEGRRLTELLNAGLCASFIVSSGFIKSVGQTLILDTPVNEYWMPFVTGLLFWPVLLVCVWMLTQIPPPSRLDVEQRSERTPIGASDRQALLRRHGIGILLLVATYTMLTVLRSLRDDFAVEIWAAIGYSQTPSIFTLSETIVMAVVILVNAAAFLIPSNRAAFFTAIQTITAGFLLVGASTLLFQQQAVGGFLYMVTLGVGTYAPYVAFHTTLFERMIALFRDKANLGYLMYLADAFGYLGYVAVLLLRNSWSGEMDFLRATILTSLTVSVSCLVLALAAFIYFRRQADRIKDDEPRRLVPSPAR